MEYLEFSYNGIKYIYKDNRLFIDNIVYYALDNWVSNYNYKNFIDKKYLVLKHEPNGYFRFPNKYLLVKHENGGYFTFSNSKFLTWENILLDDIIELKSIRGIYSILE